jgi:NADP-dependent 3-hydroxy acid dehydrogenase YdfG
VTSPDALRGRTALVAGASRGIGRCIAEQLAAAGAQVWLAARSSDLLAEVAGSTGGTALPLDLTDDASVWSAMDQLREQEAIPHIVVNAAGVFSMERLADETVRDFDLNLSVNLRGAFLLVRALLPDLLERGSGLIVNVGSVAGRKAFAGNAAYSASKFGLRGMHEVLLEEIRGTGVRATLVEPAATDTSIWDPFDPDADPALPDRSGMLDPDDVAEAVLFAATRSDNIQIPVIQIERA